MIIFVGVAGSGKSIQGRLLAQELHCDYFAMGSFLREHVDSVIQQKMLTGELISDEDVIRVIDGALQKTGAPYSEFVLDGFPRTVRQSDWLLDQVKNGRIKIRAVIHLNASPEVIVPRLLERKRPDDYIEAINKRLAEYKQHIIPIIEKFNQSKVKIYEIDAEQPIEAVHAEIMSVLQT